jgi:plastocyanin
MHLGRLPALLAAVAFAAVLTAGIACGGDDDGDGTAPANTQVPAGAPHIDQDGLAFKPKELTAKVGDSVYFTNSETAVHTVTINGTNESGTMKHNDVFAWKPPAAGEYKVTCDFHLKMRATITVE